MLKKTWMLFLPLLLFAGMSRMHYLEKYSSEKRIALIISNQTYSYLPSIKTAFNDALALKSVLEKQGFYVMFVSDADTKKMRKAIDRFIRKIPKKSVALFYYVGHSVRVEDQNYLIPSDDSLLASIDAKYEGIALKDILERLGEKQNRQNFVLLDASYMHPFHDSKGLAPVESYLNTFVAFSHLPYQAKKQKEIRSTFMDTLLKELKNPKEASIMFDDVRGDIVKESKRKEIVWSNTFLEEPFYFTLPSQTQSLKEASFTLTIDTLPKEAQIKILNIVPVFKNGMHLPKGFYDIEVSKKGYKTALLQLYIDASTQKKITLDKLYHGDKEEEVWNSVARKNSEEAYNGYLKHFPKGVYVFLAKEKIKRIAFERVKKELHQLIKKNSITALEDFMLRYPDHPLSREASYAIHAIKRKQQASQLKEIQAAWQTIENSPYANDYGDFLKNYPDSPYTQEAKRKMLKRVGKYGFTLHIDVEAGVKVDIKELSHFCNGSKIPAGKYTITVSKRHFMPIVKQIELGQNIKLSFKLKPTIYKWDNRIYTGERKYTRSGPQSIEDLYSKVIWMEKDDGIKRTWKEAKSYCQTIEHEGFKDWRLPSKQELYFLSDKKSYNPAVSTPLIKVKSRWYWSISESNENSNKAWGVNFLYGMDVMDYKSYKGYVLCVR